MSIQCEVCEHNPIDGKLIMPNESVNVCEDCKEDLIERFSLRSQQKERMFVPKVDDVVGVILIVLIILMIMGFAGAFGY